jgi:hypothetical protein
MPRTKSYSTISEAEKSSRALRCKVCEIENHKALDWQERVCKCCGEKEHLRSQCANQKNVICNICQKIDQIRKDCSLSIRFRVRGPALLVSWPTMRIVNASIKLKPCLVKNVGSIARNGYAMTTTKKDTLSRTVSIRRISLETFVERSIIFEKSDLSR